MPARMPELTLRKRSIALAASLCAMSTAVAAAQSVDTLDLTSVGRDARWKVANRATSLVEVKGKRALRLSEAPGVGVLWLEGYDFANGTIDVDILGRSQPVQGSFVGVAFHVIEAATHEAVYFRPFNFRARDSTAHSHAVQYVSDPQWPWDRLRRERPGAFERAITPDVDGDAWFHARIVVARRKVSVYVNDASTPTLVVDELDDRARGAVGLWVGEGSGGYFANLRVRRAP